MHGVMHPIGFMAGHAPYVVHGGESGIRTRGTPFGIHSLSRRAPSASSVISPFFKYLIGRRFAPIHAENNFMYKLLILKICVQLFYFNEFLNIKRKEDLPFEVFKYFSLRLASAMAL